MDIAEVKKLFKNKSDPDFVTKQVTDRIKETAWQKQNMREGFTETFDPLIQSQDKVKKTIDKQQDSLIKQLKENQQAITTGLDRLNEDNQLVLKLNESVGSQLEPQSTKPKDLNKIFNTSDLTIISKYGIPAPQNWRGSTKETLEDALDITNDEIKSLTGQINGRSRKQKPTADDRREITELKKEKGVLYKYKNHLLTAIYSTPSSHTGSGLPAGAGLRSQSNRREQSVIDRIKKLGEEISGGNMDRLPEFLYIAKQLNQSRILPTKEMEELLRRLSGFVVVKTLNKWILTK